MVSYRCVASHCLPHPRFMAKLAMLKELSIYKHCIDYVTNIFLFIQVFGAWSYHTTKMNLTNTHTEVNLDSYEKNGEWEILNTLVRRDEFFYECCPGERFSNVAFHVSLNLSLEVEDNVYCSHDNINICICPRPTNY